MNQLEVHQIARVTHEANRGYCISIGDYSQVPWEDAPEWQRASAIAGVQAVLDGSAPTPEAQHETWCEHKRREGWRFGHIKDPEAKTHPCLVPYAELPIEQQRKDHLFRAVVGALVGHG